MENKIKEKITFTEIIKVTIQKGGEEWQPYRCVQCSNNLHNTNGHEAYRPVQLLLKYRGKIISTEYIAAEDLEAETKSLFELKCYKCKILYRIEYK